MDFQSEKSFGKLRLRAFQPYHQILCMSKHVEDVEDRSNTHKGCNAMYVEDVEDGKRTYHTFWLITSLILNGFQSEKGIKEVMSQNVWYVLFPSSTSSTYIALQPLCVFDLSSTSLTCFDIHRI